MTTEETNQIQNLVNDAASEVALGKEALAAIKAAKAGDKSALISLLPKVAADVKRDIADVKAALPVIKAGWKTSEFWLIVLTGVIGIVAAARGIKIDVNLAAVWGAVVSVYTLIRTIIKKPATPAAQ